jgi:hypothetical protein
MYDMYAAGNPGTLSPNHLPCCLRHCNYRCSACAKLQCSTERCVSEITALLYPSSALVLPGAWYTRPVYNGCSGDK